MRLVITLLVFALASQGLSQQFDELIDYESLGHFVELADFRAGNHDPSGENDYFFELHLMALAILKEERKKDLTERKSVARVVGEFADIKLKTLSFWQKKSPHQIRIEGDELRDLTSEAMRTLQLPESKLAILVLVKLFERNKKFLVIGENTLIGTTNYYLIPETLPHEPKVENKIYEITDEQGTYVRLKTNFDLLDPKRKKKK